MSNPYTSNCVLCERPHNDCVCNPQIVEVDLSEPSMKSVYQRLRDVFTPKMIEFPASEIRHWSNTYIHLHPTLKEGK